MSAKLTGRQRHRVGFRGRLVLQVEEEVVYSCGDPQCCDSDGYKTVGWRDARVEDLSIFPRGEEARYATPKT